MSDTGCALQATCAATDVEVAFAVVAETAFKSHVRLVGSLDMLGTWDPVSGVELHTGPSMYPKWSTTVRLPAEHCCHEDDVEFKYVIVQQDGQVLWEEGPNRRLSNNNLCCHVFGDSGIEAARHWQASRSGPPGTASLPTQDPATRALHINPVVVTCASQGGHEEAAEQDRCPEAVADREAQSDEHAETFVEQQQQQDQLQLPPVLVETPLGSKVVIEAECHCTRPGDVLAVAGAAPVLGCWDPWRGLQLATRPSSFPRWCGTILFDTKKVLGAWKLVILRADGMVDWEPCQDRTTEPECSFNGEAFEVKVTFGTETAVLVRHLEAEQPEPHLRCRASDFVPLEVLSEAQGACPKSAKLDQGSVVLPEHLHQSKCLNLNGKVAAPTSSTGANAGAAPKLDRSPTKILNLALLDSDTEAPASCKGIKRPSSTASTASTCTSEDPSEDNGDAREQLIESKPFSQKVFEVLIHEDLRSWLSGFKLPSTPEARESSGQHWLWSGAHRIQKPCGRCEDAFFHGRQSLGVADGVGSMVQFTRYGADAAAYAAELMVRAAAALEPGAIVVPDGRTMGPDERAAAALARAERQATRYGASTATVLVLEGSEVGVANLGDSGFMVLRRGPRGHAIAARSREQQHSFNCPYQLVRLPPALQSRIPKDMKMDTADCCERYVVPVQPGDLLLLFTDGLVDNIYDRELLQIVDRALAPGMLQGSGTGPQRVAKALALAAQERSLDETAPVPFVEASLRAGESTCLGGKPDDITVVAAWVIEALDTIGTVKAMVQDP